MSQTISETIAPAETRSVNMGWIVTFAGTGINLALGILYTWSVIKGKIPEAWGWSEAQKSDPYAIACFVFAIAMVVAGRLQDKLGPRIVATIGGAAVALGCIIAGLAGSSYAGFVVGFGVLTGAGIGFGYASATPPAVKWFPPAKTGLIAGLVVAGFGLASVYISPLATWLLNTYGVSNTMIIFGAAFLVVVCGLAQLLKNPPAGYKPQAPASAAKAAALKPAIGDKTWRDMLASPNFWVLWLMFFFGSAVGLTVIGSAQGIAKQSLGDAAFWAVAVLAVGNAGGRIAAGVVSDRIGRQWTMFLSYVVQCVMVMIPFFFAESVVALLFAVLMIGACYGANLSLFPSATKDYFGLKNFGLNYGVMFSAWGVAGLTLPRVDGMIKDAVFAATGAKPMYAETTMYITISLMVVAAVLTFVSRAIVSKSK
ncbi:MAG: MFS transporter [Myxococcales bacterium]|nr:MAG: MFS transporter [Myxococcales bacterium]